MKENTQAKYFMRLFKRVIERVREREREREREKERDAENGCRRLVCVCVRSFFMSAN